MIAVERFDNLDERLHRFQVPALDRDVGKAQRLGEPCDLQMDDFETRRHWKILDDRLAGRKYMLGDVYTIVDMSVWGWSSAAPFLLGAETWSKMSNVKRLVDEINERPAVARVNKLKEKHAFKQEFDEEAKRHLFPHQTQKAS